jgi:hypothetical protein
MAVTDIRRSILVESDNVEMISLRIDGEGLTRLARMSWDGKQFLRALSLLMDGCRGLQWEVAVKILEGKLCLRGVSPEIKVVPDSELGHMSFDQAMAASDEANVYGQIGKQAVHPGKPSRMDQRELEERIMGPRTGASSKQTMTEELYNALIDGNGKVG